MKPIYLDYNATTPIAPEVADAMIPMIRERFGNPSSSHWSGMDAKDAVDLARRQIAQLLECSTEEIIFTGCATESNNLAVLGSALFRKAGHIITSAIEHPAVLEVCRYCRQQGFDLSILPVDGDGLINPADVKSAIRPNTILITIMHANNETGVIQPVKTISDIARSHGIPFHTDAAQSCGKIRVTADDTGADLLTIAGHKFYGPKGIGALYIRKGTQIRKIFHGANHENNLRPGTENVVGIIGLGAACELASRNLPERTAHLKFTRDLLHQLILEKSPDVRMNGPEFQRLPNTLSLGFKNLTTSSLLNELLDLAVSAGAACHSAGQIDISHVLKAMNVPAEYAMGTLRFSTGMMTTEAEIRIAAGMVNDAVEYLT